MYVINTACMHVAGHLAYLFMLQVSVNHLQLAKYRTEEVAGIELQNAQLSYTILNE